MEPELKSIIGSLFMITTYSVYCLFRHGITDSVSETAKLAKTFGELTWFIATLMFTSLFLMWQLDGEKPQYDFILFLAIAGIWLTAAAYNYWETYAEKYHVYGATMGFVLMCTWSWFSLGLWLPTILTLVTVVLTWALKMKRAKTLVIEYVGIYSNLIAILIYRLTGN